MCLNQHSASRRLPRWRGSSYELLSYQLVHFCMTLRQVQCMRHVGKGGGHCINIERLHS